MSTLAVSRTATTIDAHRGVYIFPEEALTLWPQRRAPAAPPLTRAQVRARLRYRGLRTFGAPPVVDVQAPALLSLPRRFAKAAAKIWRVL
jgi:hypothetical protein